MQTVILTVKIPNIHSSRKVKVCLDETVGELIRSIHISYLQSYNIIMYSSTATLDQCYQYTVEPL